MKVEFTDEEIARLASALPGFSPHRPGACECMCAACRLHWAQAGEKALSWLAVGRKAQYISWLNSAPEYIDEYERDVLTSVRHFINDRCR